MFKKRIQFIQEYLIKNNIDAYIAFLSDDHGSEYITSRYKSIAFLCGFTGSAATLLISKTNAYLWTDGRYFLQANMQLKQSDTILKKIGIDESIQDFIKENISSLVFDFEVASVSFVNSILKVKKGIKLYDENNLIDKVWTNRPNLSNKKIFLLPECVCKYSASEKCVKAIKHISSKNNFGILISALDDIAYMLNARGFDIPCNPVFMSFLFLSKVEGVMTFTLYINKSKISDEVYKKLQTQNIIIKPYLKIYDDVKTFKYKIYYDYNKTNYKLFSLMKNKKERFLWPSKAKAIKNLLEIKETKNAHIKDGVAMCKFLYYIKNNVGKKYLDEISVASYLAKLRKKCGAFQLSFNTICGYKENGAIIHYSATNETNKKIENDGFLLVDSGGQYFYGTTDITRTIALNNITAEMKYHFTLTLKAHIALSLAVFNKNTTDKELDYISRKPLWDASLDYNHGTGHGIGFMLNVHEGPQSIRYNKVNPVKMQKGMITSNEPGLYFENKYGIRHENELLCIKKDEKHLGFEPITYVPFDLDGIDVNLLTTQERKWLNDYHKMVYDKIYKYLTKKERNFLLKQTREI